MTLRIFLKNNTWDSYGSNTPEFVFANIHGHVQVKMKKSSKYGLFIDIKSISDLAQVIARANDCDQTMIYHHAKEGSWDNNSEESNSDDDMGFGLFEWSSNRYSGVIRLEYRIPPFICRVFLSIIFLNFAFQLINENS